MAQASPKLNSGRVTGPHDGAVAERGGSSERGLACAMVYGFQRFRAQIKAEDEGFSPRGTTGGSGHREITRDGDRLHSPPRVGVSRLQGIPGDQKALGRVEGGGFSSSS
jgi:hypothetical protein